MIIVLLALFSGVVLYSGKYAGRPKTESEKIADKAAREQSPSRCEQLSIKVEEIYYHDGEQRTSITHPQDECLKSYLLKTNDQNVCDKFSDKENKRWCISYIAEVYSDPNWCSKLDAQDPAYWLYSVLCRAVATLNIKECAPLDKPELKPPVFAYAPKTDCIREIVLRTHNYNDCLLIDGPAYGFFDKRDARNNCLKTAGCDKPEKRKEICSLIEYNQWVLPEEKRLCLTEKWDCPSIPQRIGNNL